jgi:hypothetical protein
MGKQPGTGYIPHALQSVAAGLPWDSRMAHQAARTRDPSATRFIVLIGKLFAAGELSGKWTPEHRQDLLETPKFHDVT